MGKKYQLLILTLFLFIMVVSSVSLAEEELTIYGISHACPQTNVTIELAKEYSAMNPDVEVIIDSIPYDDMEKKVAMDAASGAGQYDFYLQSHDIIIRLIAGNFVAPIDDYLEPERFEAVTGMSWEDWDYEDFAACYRIGRCQWDGVTYGIPWRGDTQMLFYRKDLFEDQKNKEDFKAKYGYELPSPPETIEQFMDCLQFFNKPDEDFYGGEYCMTQKTQAMHAFAFLLESSGGLIHDRETNHFEGYLNSELSVKVLEEMVESFNYMLPGASARHVFETAVDFCQGKIAMLINWPFVGPMVSDPTQSVLIPADEKVAYALHPHAEGQKPAYGAYGWGFYFNNSSKNLDEAFKFAVWCSSKEQEKRHAAEGTPTRNSVMLDPELSKKIPAWPMLKEACDVAIRPPVYAYFPFNTELRDAIEEYLTLAFVGEMSPKEALDKAAEKAENICKRYGYIKD